MFTPRTPGLCLALATLLHLTTPPAAQAGGLLMASDTTWKRIRMFDPERATLVYDLSLVGPWALDSCDGHLFFCYPMGFNHVVHQDKDFLDVAVGRVDPAAASPSMAFPSVVTRFELGPTPRAVWTMKYLDFRGLDDWTRYCDQAADEPHGDRAEVGCGVQFVHAFRVQADDPAAKTVSLVVGDPNQSRILGVDLDYSGGSQTGVVRWVLGADTPGWPAGGFPNGIQYLGSEPGGPYLLVSFYQDGQPDHGGTVILFQAEGEGWTPAWQFPDPAQGGRPYIHAPHMAQLLYDPTTDEPFIFYAHGRGLTTDWYTDPDTDRGGSVGVLALGGRLTDPPVYLGEAALNRAAGGTTFLYPRDIEFTDAGTLWITDAPCETFCPEPGLLHEIAPFHHGLGPSPKTGHFSGDHSDQDLVDVTGADALRSVDCGMGVLFEGDWLEPEDMGRHLRRAMRTAVTRCEGAGPPMPAP